MGCGASLGGHYNVIINPDSKPAPLKVYKEERVAFVVEALIKCMAFKRVGKAGCKEMANKMRPVDFRAGDFILREGEVTNRFFVLLEGEVEVSVAGHKRAASYSVQECGSMLPGGLMGEDAVILQGRSMRTFVAATAVVAWALDRGDIPEGRWRTASTVYATREQLSGQTGKNFHMPTARPAELKADPGKPRSRAESERPNTRTSTFDSTPNPMSPPPSHSRAPGRGGGQAGAGSRDAAPGTRPPPGSPTSPGHERPFARDPNTGANANHLPSTYRVNGVRGAGAGAGAGAGGFKYEERYAGGGKGPNLAVPRAEPFKKRGKGGGGETITSKNIETPYGLLNSTKADQLPSVQFEESARSMLSDTHRELASNYGA